MKADWDEFAESEFYFWKKKKNFPELKRYPMERQNLICGTFRFVVFILSDSIKKSPDWHLVKNKVQEIYNYLLSNIK